MKKCVYCGLTLWSLFDKYHFRCWHSDNITRMIDDLIKTNREAVALGNELKKYYKHD